MDLTKTRRELIDQVLGNMQLLAPGQTPADEDVQRVDGVIDTVVESLNARDIVYVSDPGRPGPRDGAIAAALFLPLAHCVAKEAGAGFGLGSDPGLTALAGEAERHLKTITRPARSRRLMRIDTSLAGTRRPHFNFTRGT